MATTTSTADQESSAADEGNETRTAVQKLREQADAVVERIQPQIAAVSSYVRDEPTKALLISAAAGAALMGLFALIVRSSGRSQVPGASAGRSAMAAIRDAALDLADSAQTMALDALEATQKRASAAADSVTESVADTWKKVRDQAAPVVEKIKPQLDAAAAYAKEEPARTALGLAVAGAVIAGLIALARQSEDDSLS